MCRRLQDKNALITGGSRGIGFAVAVRYAREGASVALLARSRENLAQAAERLRESEPGAEAMTVDAVVGEREQVEAAVAEAVARLGRVDVLVNSAGIASLGEVDAMAPDEWERMVRVNLLGTYYVIRALWPHLKEQGGGSIINLSSGSGRRAHAGWSAYCVSKFGVMGLTDALQKEGRPHGIRVNVICPGPTDTEQRRANFGEEAAETLMQPEEVAEAAVFFASDESRWVSGPGIDVRRGPI